MEEGLHLSKELAEAFKEREKQKAKEQKSLVDVDPNKTGFLKFFSGKTEQKIHVSKSKRHNKTYGGKEASGWIIAAVLGGLLLDTLLITWLF